MTELLSWGTERKDQVPQAKRLFTALFKASLVTAEFPSEDLMQQWRDLSTKPMT